MKSAPRQRNLETILRSAKDTEKTANGPTNDSDLLGVLLVGFGGLVKLVEFCVIAVQVQICLDGPMLHW